jgi:CheY-like chemotaxis protein
MDVRMPELDGKEATRAIRRRFDPGHLPVIGLSGMGDQDDIQECLRAGMNDFITKPVRFVRVLEVLNGIRDKIGANGGAARSVEATEPVEEESRELQADTDTRE